MVKNFDVTLKRRYILALSLIAALAIISQLIIQITVMKGEDDSRVVNIAGRQRMLSQRINKCALGINTAENETIRQHYRDELQLSIKLWASSHKGLQFGDAALGLPGNNSSKIKALFASIEANHQAILSAATQIAKQVDKTAFPEEIAQIRDNEKTFLKGMDEIVFLYDQEAKDRINVIKHVEIGILLFTLLVLALEARFIFMPAERKIREDMLLLRDSEENLRRLFETAPTAMLQVRGDDLGLIQLNVHARDMLGLQDKETGGSHLDAFLDADADRIKELTTLLKKKPSVQNYEVGIKTQNGKFYIVLLSAHELLFNKQNTIVVGLTDITHLKEAEDILRYRATTDDMTGLANRRTGIDILGMEFERSKRSQRPLTICFVDINDLKRVNDTYGHSEGDWMIKTASRAIREIIRAHDTAARLGGDEFLIILPDCDEAAARNVMNRIESLIHQINRNGDKPYLLGISYGLCEYKTVKPSNVDEFITTADHLMYEDKRAKKTGNSPAPE
ncbi:PAS domain S-box-containing protein/diguanylate cyclase (GGDEF) domain-containing protein [Formivibrio citricus]|uniref:diguanylate cyclase n=1 Tax=Formivibrio citricus TaxID=83765 RepID=A0A1I4V4Q6_9NEIS|nr:diguanylate cyclase [Formivibrio citricus]SFM96176.1 PAS domain S-box-containing protein/diguanylate cyclase (GGDEF) domain-containing protein [Formivibrio citricus]